MASALDFSTPHLLRDEGEYEAALREIERLLEADPSPGSEAHERLEFLAVLVEHFEEEHHPVDTASPRRVVGFMMEQKGLDRSDLEPLMGGKSRVSEFFSGKRDLSRSQIDALRKYLGVPADVLMG